MTDMVESLHGLIDKQDAELSDLRASNARMSEVLSSIRDRLGLDDGGSILDALDQRDAMLTKALNRAAELEPGTE